MKALNSFISELDGIGLGLGLGLGLNVLLECKIPRRHDLAHLATG